MTTKVILLLCLLKAQDPTVKLPAFPPQPAREVAFQMNLLETKLPFDWDQIQNCALRGNK